jgi:hypothetical protein
MLYASRGQIGEPEYGAAPPEEDAAPLHLAAYAAV